MKKGKLIVIEGIDGAGKSTLCEHLRNSGYKIFGQPTREDIGLVARGYQMENSLTVSDSVRDEIVNLLITADRYHQFHREDGVIDNLNNGIDVVLDRHFISGLAYSSGELLTMDTNLELHMKLPLPDKVIYLDLKPTDALKRLEESNRGSLDEYESLPYLEKRYLNYHSALTKTKSIGVDVVIVDAREDKETIKLIVEEEIKRCLEA